VSEMMTWKSTRKGIKTETQSQGRGNRNLSWMNWSGRGRKFHPINFSAIYIQIADMNL